MSASGRKQPFGGVRRGRGALSVRLAGPRRRPVAFVMPPTQFRSDTYKQHRTRPANAVFFQVIPADADEKRPGERSKLWA